MRVAAMLKALPGATKWRYARCAKHTRILALERISTATRRNGVVTIRGEQFICKQCRIRIKRFWPGIVLGWTPGIANIATMMSDELGRLGALWNAREHELMLRRHAVAKCFIELKTTNPGKRISKTQVATALGIARSTVRY